MEAANPRLLQNCPWFKKIFPPTLMYLCACKRTGEGKEDAFTAPTIYNRQPLVDGTKSCSSLLPLRRVPAICTRHGHLFSLDTKTGTGLSRRENATGSPKRGHRACFNKKPYQTTHRDIESGRTALTGLFQDREKMQKTWFWLCCFAVANNITKTKSFVNKKKRS